MSIETPIHLRRRFYITGESYAGHYIPAIGHALLKQPIQGLNFQGVAIGNGWVDPVAVSCLSVIMDKSVAVVAAASLLCPAARMTFLMPLSFSSNTLRIQSSPGKTI